MAPYNILNANGFNSEKGLMLSLMYRMSVSVDIQLPVARQLFVRLCLVHPFDPENRFGLCHHGHSATATESRHVFQSLVVVGHFVVLQSTGTEHYIIYRFYESYNNTLLYLRKTFSINIIIFQQIITTTF